MSARVLYMSSLPDEQLWELVRQDDIEAFNTLYRKHWKQLYNAAYKRLQDKEACEELVQDLFVYLYGSRHQLEINQSLIGYLHSAVRNKVLNCLRQKATEQKHVHQAASTKEEAYHHVELSVEYNELAHALQFHVEQMPDRNREVYLLNREQHLSVSEVAQHLQRPVSTVEKQLKKAISYLRLHLQDYFALVLFFQTIG
ncbi:RNA polymerase sigma factor [Rufibacter hautae]|uniref:Sigma-70 family RNA polymerase sigma factor n=1 Tax=Rufibacter hautae TaxID=2595005 RepID=A0A5B6TCL0_9BACT|nr:sigma-70 family RNA polymerase sigma factor [Rufibacter hautae]KAA3438197.1 sigma-70 family RNA polymerase sigma factor [Rufibacter hautae]